MNKNTFNGMIARGIDSNLANELIQKWFTVWKLKQLNKSELLHLWILEKYAENIINEKRPPIPEKIVIKLLYESKRTCCICRDSSKPIIIHHLKEWNYSKNHSEDNLVVLCLNHHSEAHTKKDLAINLKPDHIKKSKQKWLEKVELSDTKTVLWLSTSEYWRWDYFNHNRIFELFLDMKLSNNHYKATERVKTLWLIDSLGTFWIEDSNKSQKYDFDNGYILYYYMKELFENVIKNIWIIDITDKYNKKDLISIITIGSYISFQWWFYFKNLSETNKWRKQRRICYYKKNKIQLEFEFDAYESTSNSAWGSHLTSKNIITPIWLVKSIKNDNNYLIITISCLAIWSHFKQHQSRSKYSYWRTDPTF